MIDLQHQPVMLQEAISALNPQSEKIYLDGTLGGAGHAVTLSTQLDETNILIGLDQDPVALEKASSRLANTPSQIILLKGNFGDLQAHLKTAGVQLITGGILLDLGVSDFQIKVPERGFSFMHEAPLDMRMNPDQALTAATIVNTWPVKEMADCFYQFSDERLSRPIARAIEAARPIETTTQLAELLRSIYRQKGVKAHNIHPATRVFQALRIAVNGEFKVLTQFLEQLPDALSPGARIAIITFHSGEERLVKHWFREACADCMCPPRQPLCTCSHQQTFKAIGKPKKPSTHEIEQNPQARSARLWVFERL